MSRCVNGDLCQISWRFTYLCWKYPIFSRRNYQFWFATRWFGNFREVSPPEGESRPIPFKNGLGVRFGSDDSGTPISAAGWITPSHAICVASPAEESKLLASRMPRLITPPFLETSKSPFLRHVFPDRGLSRNPVRSGKKIQNQRQKHYAKIRDRKRCSRRRKVVCRRLTSWRAKVLCSIEEIRDGYSMGGKLYYG
jgi:hypothetical protein